jgi:hypothetical protein
MGGLALVAGCRAQEQNPFGAFGPATIPPPTIEVPGGAGYYPTNSPAALPATTPPANSLPSISVPGGDAPAGEPRIPRPYSFGSLSPGKSAAATSAAPTTNSTADSADREPIRIVEAAPSAGRFSPSVPPSVGSPATVLEAAPAAREPIRAFTNNTNNPPSRLTEPVEISRLPALDRMRGFTPTPQQTPAFGQPPAAGTKSSGLSRTDPSVRPAAYEPLPQAFTEPQSAGGQWRSR